MATEAGIGPCKHCHAPVVWMEDTTGRLYARCNGRLQGGGNCGFAVAPLPYPLSREIAATLTPMEEWTHERHDSGSGGAGPAQDAGRKREPEPERQPEPEPERLGAMVFRGSRTG